MGFFKNILFGKIDLDSIVTALVLGVNPEESNLQCKSGSASGEELLNPLTLCIEVGGTGRIDENNFDHHDSSERVDLSACAQALERLAKLVHYVDEVDRGVKFDLGKDQNCYPSLIQLVSGMLLTIKDPIDQMKEGLSILRVVLQSGLDPYGSMAKIVDYLPDAKIWLENKRKHEQLFEEVCLSAKWFATKSGKKLAAVETTWVGVPGALYGKGAEIVIALNPNYERAGKNFRKFTIAGKDIVVTPVSEILNQLESGWGGPNHGTIIGSPVDYSSNLSLEEVIEIVISNL